jgi:hypothetical protein
MHRLRVADEADSDRARRYRERPSNVWLSGVQESSAVHHRQRLDRGLVSAEANMNIVYHREKCLAEASICREKSRADPARSDYWIDRAVIWHQRAALASHANALTHEIHDGPLISKPAV